MSYISHYPMEKLLESRVRASVRVIQKTFQTNQRRKDGFKLNSFHRFTRRMILGRIRIVPSSSLLLSPTIFTKVSALSVALRHFRPFKAPFPFPLAFDTCIPNWERKSSTHGNTSYEWKVPLWQWQKNWALHSTFSAPGEIGYLSASLPLCAKFKLGCLDKAPNMPREGKWALWPISPAY